MKNLNKLTILAFASALALTSCGKKDAATTKELDGEWTVTSVTNVSTSKTTNTNGTSKEVSEESVNYSVTGSTISGTSKSSTTSTYGSTTQITSSPERKISGTSQTKVTFSKKDGTYKNVETGEKITEYTQTENQSTYYDNYKYTTVVKITDEYTQTMEGSYYLNQKAGDLDKGTKLIVDVKSDVRKGTITTETTTTTTYGSQSSISSSKMTKDYTTTYTREGASETMVYDVVESTKSSLKLDYVGTYKLDEETATTQISGSTTTIDKDEQSTDVTATTSIELEK